jgi:hypothetical protein
MASAPGTVAGPARAPLCAAAGYAVSAPSKPPRLAVHENNHRFGTVTCHLPAYRGQPLARGGQRHHAAWVAAVSLMDSSGQPRTVHLSAGQAWMT